MADGDESRIIDHDVFVNGHAFDFENQHYLKLLFRAVRDKVRPLTLVVGAGVSMNASLPSWPGLVSKMTAAIEDETLRAIAKGDPSDPMRKAEIILHLAKLKNLNAAEHEIIRDALYQKDLQVSPGQLALSLARLIYVRRKVVKLLTTNFDIILEDALENHFDKGSIGSFSLDDWPEWATWSGKDKVGVLHLHGFVRQHESPGNPLILTESQFLRHGEQVRRIVSDSLEGSCAIFVGLSMSDPNLIGPLYQSRLSDSPRFALVVPEKATEAKNAESARYAIESAKYLERKLGLKPIFLKSYSQLNQVISDLALAVAEPKRYLTDDDSAPDSLVYHRRLARALDTCYSAVGCESDVQVPLGDAARTLSELLHSALLMTGGPVDVLADLSRTYGSHDERFALFLWLRSRTRPDAKTRYALTVMGTSAYVHREVWSLRTDVDIERDSDFAAAQAVFDGSHYAVNMDPAPNTSIWHGIVAAPVVVGGTSSGKKIGAFDADVLTVGAITLNSTRKVTREDLPEDRTAPEDYSIISKLESKHFNLLIAALGRAAARVLNS